MKKPSQKYSRENQLQAFDRLLTIMDELREQCPWDMKQTMDSLRHLTIEETYELSDAIIENDREEIKQTLRDMTKGAYFFIALGVVLLIGIIYGLMTFL